MQVYLDNAATTPVDEAVVKRMSDAMRSVYGNPSAIHSLGRKAKAEIELVRKSIAHTLNCQSREIYFTGSGTEADNMAIRCAVKDLNVRHIITSEIEHKAVIETARDLEAQGKIELHVVAVDSFGRARLDELDKLAAEYNGALISLMHANNEIATLNDLRAISQIARKHNCYFHSDTVQSMAHYAFDLKELDIDFITCSAHKFHGPKGVGFLYKNARLSLRSLMTGGGQESKMRPGTENVVGIIGLGMAFHLAYEHLKHDQQHIKAIKKYTIDRLKEKFEGIRFNGDISEDGSLFTVLSISLPPSDINSTLLFQLDIAGVCVSGGSACNSGAMGVSHVLSGIGQDEDRSAIRVSFSKYTTTSDIDYLVQTLTELIPAEVKA